MNVRQYITDGEGKVNVASIAGYPMEVPGTAMQHIVTSLGKAHLCIIPYLTQTQVLLSHRASGAI